MQATFQPAAFGCGGNDHASRCLLPRVAVARRKATAAERDRRAPRGHDRCTARTHSTRRDLEREEAMMTLHIPRSAARRQLPTLAQLRPLRILVADDDREMRRLIVASLNDDGYEVIEVSDGKRLLELVASQLLSPEHE